MLKSKTLRLVLALAAGLGAPLLAGGCKYVCQATGKDLRRVGEVPRSIWEGTKKDFAIYRIVSPR
jgi:hypothetical protein